MAKPKTTSKAKTKTPDPALPEIDVSIRTLEDTPARAVELLRGIGTSIRIRSLMRARGYQATDHSEGWSLVQRASGFVEDDDLATLDDEVTSAISAIDARDEDIFRIVRSLQRRHPAAAKTLLADLGPREGVESVLQVKTLLERVDVMAKSKSKADRDAIATLGARGLDEAERARLRGLIATAQTLREGDEDDGARVENEAAHLAALAELRAWYTEWTEVARSAIKRRDDLIRLGLANRRSPSKASSDDGGEGPPTPAS